MGQFLDLINQTAPVPGEYDASLPDKSTADLWKNFGSKLDSITTMADPNTTNNMFAPGDLETSDPSRISQTDHNSLLRNMWNSFKELIRLK